MKLTSLLLIAIAVLSGGSQINGQFSDLCLPKPMREVPITLQIKKASELAACGEDGLLALSDLASLAENQIMKNYQPPAQSPGCKLVSLEHTSCEVIGRQGQRVLIHYKSNITCSNGCYYLNGYNQKDKDAINVYTSHVDSLLRASRTKSSAEFNYGTRRVEIFYFKGRKGRVVSTCGGATVQNGVNRKIPACKCPSSCPDPCTLPPETGRCRARIPRYYHNPVSGQCELFTYGGCGGNQNRFTTQAECEKACKVCPSGKVYLECGTDCPDTCDNKDDGVRICNLRCVQGCFCPTGTVELGDECVAPEDCPSTNTTVVEEQCPEGKIYKECGTACPLTCDKKDDIINCITVCVPGCFCPDGTVELDGECVSPEDCPSTNTTVVEEQCPASMVYKECGTACPRTCDNKDDNIHCITVCIPGCFCPDGKLLLEEAGGETKCVDREECPPSVDRECPEGKIYKQCGTACPLTCENKDENIICTRQCVPGCFCPDGYVEKGNSCVRPKECDTELCSLPPETGPCRAYFRRYFYNATSKQCEQFIYGGCRGNGNNFETIEDCEAKCNEEFECPNGKEYQECGTSCPTTCENKDEILICTLQCVQGCFCPTGTVELGDECVAPEECPSTNTTVVEEQCPEGKIYKDCGTACPLTCDNKDDIINCITVCVPGCFCPSGTVELGSECVAPEDCPSTDAPVATTEVECPEGMVFDDCGTACPTTCDNKDQPVRPCTLQCVPGCVCIGDTILLEEEGDVCVAEDQCPN